jgi:hypothetical protein
MRRKQEGIETERCVLYPNTLSKYLPIDVLEWVHENVRFEYQDRAPAISFHKVEFGDEPLNKLLDRKPAQGILLLCDSLWNESSKKQEFIILHEIAHLWLKHHGICGKNQSEKENEADVLAEKWIADYSDARRVH